MRDFQHSTTKALTLMWDLPIFSTSIAGRLGG